MEKLDTAIQINESVKWAATDAWNSVITIKLKIWLFQLLSPKVLLGVHNYPDTLDP